VIKSLCGSIFDPANWLYEIKLCMIEPCKKQFSDDNKKGFRAFVFSVLLKLFRQVRSVFDDT